MKMFKILRNSLFQTIHALLFRYTLLTEFMILRANPIELLVLQQSENVFLVFNACAENLF